MSRDKKTGIVTPPKDQSFDGGFSIEMNHYSGTVFTGRKTVRFQHADELADYWEQNREKKPFKKTKRNKTRKGETAIAKSDRRSRNRDDKRERKPGKFHET